MSKRVTFSQIDAVLEKLGFEQTVISGSHVNYRREPTDTPLMVQLHRPKDIVPDFVLAYVRHELDRQGVIASEEFEKMLLNAAA